MISTSGSDIGGLGPQQPAACRVFLQAALEGHIDVAHTVACTSCAERHALRQSLQFALRTRPRPPANLSSRSLIEATLERIVEAAEESNALAAWIGKRDAVLAPDLAWPEPLLGSQFGQAMESSPPLPSAAAWASVKRDLIATLDSRRTARPQHHLWLGAVAVAAAAAIAVWLQPAGTKPTATIAFLDLDKPPTADYPWLGIRR